MAADLDTLTEACDKQEEKRSDEFYTYDAPTCTVQYDKEVCYFTSEQDPMSDMPVYMDTEHCIKEEVPAEDCCQAKRDGKAGMGLDNACTSITITPSGDSEPATEPETTTEEEEEEVMDAQEDLEEDLMEAGDDLMDEVPSVPN